MRLSVLTAFLLGGLTLAGCTSSSTPENLVSGMSARDLTGSVGRSAGPTPSAAVPSAPVPSAPVPSANIGNVAAAVPAAQPQQQLAWAGQMPEPQAFEPPATTVGMPLPTERPITAMMMPKDSAPAGLSQSRSRIYGHRFSDAKPINFGRASPRNHAVHGVDISRWQGNIDWATLRTQGANFAFIKATDGGDHLDPMFKTNWKRAKDAGIRRGAYHFFYWCRTAGEQADWFIRNVPRDPDALPPVIDVEYNGESSCKMRLSRARVQEKMQVFMDRLERHYGKRPIIYTAPDFYKDNLSGGAFPNHPFWLRAVAQHPSVVYPGRKWIFWQYSGSGLSQGVNGKIDLNVFQGSESEWHRWVASR